MSVPHGGGGGGGGFANAAKIVAVAVVAWVVISALTTPGRTQYANAGCGGFYNEGCGSPQYQSYIAHNVHHLPRWGGNRMPPVYAPTIAPRRIRAHTVPLGYPTGYGCAGCYNGGGEFYRNREVKRWEYHIHYNRNYHVHTSAHWEVDR